MPNSHSPAFSLGKNAPESITLASADMQLMQADVISCWPEEACGLLLGTVEGKSAAVMRTVIMENMLHSTTRFRMDGAQQLAVFNQMEQDELELVGIYHSHPNGLAFPSPIDITEAYYSEVIHLIWSGKGSDWICQAYRIQEGQVLEATLRIESISET